MLDKAECLTFIEALQGIIGESRKNNYDPDKFDEYFEEFDEDKNGYIQKNEMAVFLKQVFSYTAPLESDAD